MTTSACAAGPPRGVPVIGKSPAAAVQALAVAIEQGDLSGAYRLMHPRVRSGVTEAEFVSGAADNRQELLELAALVRRRALVTRGQAELLLPGGEVATLVLDHGRFGLSGGLLDGHALATPRDAVVAFHRALQRRDLPGLLRVLSRERRTSWLAALGQGMGASEDALDLDIEIQGDRAIVTTPGGTRIHLRREVGTWHIADVVP